MIAEAACSWTRWVSLDLDVVEPGGREAGRELLARQRAGDAAGPLRHVGAGRVVHVRVGDDVGDGEAPAGAQHARGLARGPAACRRRG